MSKRGTFVKVHDHLMDHPAWIDLDPVHVGLWVLALGYCRRNRTDGNFPARMLSKAGGAADEVQALVDAGRLHRAGHDCGDCPQPADGQLYLHAYLEHQNSSEQQDELSRKRAEAGRKGGSARVAKQSANQTASNTEADASKTQPEVEREREKDSPARARAAAYAADFESWWETYPHKVGKAAAAKAYEKARRTAGVDAETLLAGVRNATAVWVAERRERQYLPHPATWLNQGRWDDQVDPLPGMPAEDAPRPVVTACPDLEPHPRHERVDGRNRFVCLGVDA